MSNSGMRTEPGVRGVLGELREWFENEVGAGDAALQFWLDKIDAALSVSDSLPFGGNFGGFPYGARRG